MRNTKSVRLVVAAMLLTSIGLQSCNVIRGIIGGTEETNKAPSVSLTASSYSIMDGATITLYATATDPDGDSLSYSWYVNSIYQSGVYSSIAYWDSSGWGGNTVTIQVTVSDGELTVSDSVYIYVAAVQTNQAPAVTLTANDTTAYSDQDITFTATATDPDGDTLTYSWQVNGTTQSNTTSSVTYYWLTSSYLYPTITVTVNDGHGNTDSDTISITVYPGASVRFANSTGQTIYYIYVRSGSASGTDLTSWGTDLLGAYTLANNNMFVVYALSGGSYYEFRADNSGHATTWNTDYYGTSSGYLMSSGAYRLFTLTSTAWTVGNSAYSAILSSGLPISENATLQDSKLPMPVAISVRPLASAQEQLSPDRDEAIPFSVLND